MRPAPTTTAARGAVPAVPRPRPSHSGCTQTPWIWLTVGDCDPTSALKTTSPFSKRAQARPAAIRLATPRPVPPPPAPAVAKPGVDTHLSDEHVDGRHQIGVEFGGLDLAHTRVDRAGRHRGQRHQRAEP